MRPSPNESFFADMSRLASSLADLDAHHRLAISAAAAAIAWFALLHRVQTATQWICTWDVFALSVLTLAWVAIVVTPQTELRGRARAQDVSSTVIFSFALAAACAGLFAVGFLFATNKAAKQPHLTGHLLLSLIAIVSAWSLVHTVFSLRYAHKFYGDDADEAGKAYAGGLEFPDEPKPNYLDFAYFSFVIGMTFQVSDVEITSRSFRQLVLLHGVLSFAFNTVILALTINTVSSLL